MIGLLSHPGYDGNGINLCVTGIWQLRSLQTQSHDAIAINRKNSYCSDASTHLIFFLDQFVYQIQMIIYRNDSIHLVRIMQNCI